jgi:hypothetical protein
MRSLTDGRCRSQISFLRQQFLQGGGLPFGDVLSKKIVSQALASSGVVWKERIYSPLVTLWVFLGQAGFRNKEIIVVTTLLDPEEFTKDDLATLYRARWNVGLDLRSVKTTMQMEVLRCKTPELVRKEIWTHVLAYNLIRTVMAQAASRHALPPRTISFKGAMQTLEAFQPLIACCSQLRDQAYERLLACIASHTVGDRAGRFEPRQVKRRPKRYQWMVAPRLETKLQLLPELA